MAKRSNAHQRMLRTNYQVSVADTSNLGHTENHIDLCQLHETFNTQRLLYWLNYIRFCNLITS